MTGSSLMGIVFGIQRLSIHDGPGIRTTVFLKGCNVTCKWCHNPEGISKQPLVGLNTERCIRCGACVAECPNRCHKIEAGEHFFDRTACTACGRCVDVCPIQALEMIGKRMMADEVMKVILKDQKFYGAEGGVTLSGGEALMQKEFALELMQRCRAHGIRVALETNGVHKRETYDEVMPYVDLFLLDYKATDPAVHKAYVGCDNRLILNNLRYLHDAGARVLVRCPIIPGVNDNRTHFDAIAQLTKDLPNLVGAEILPYHKLGVSKARRIDTEYQEFEMVDTSVSDGWKQHILSRGGRLVNVE